MPQLNHIKGWECERAATAANGDCKEAENMLKALYSMFAAWEVNFKGLLGKNNCIKTFLTNAKWIVEKYGAEKKLETSEDGKEKREAKINLIIERRSYL